MKRLAISITLLLSLFALHCAGAPADALRTDKWGYVWQNPVYRFRLVTTNDTEGISRETTTASVWSNVVRRITALIDETRDPPSYTATTNVSASVYRNEEGATATNSTWIYQTTIRSVWEDSRLFGTSVSETNTPGNVAFADRRLKAAQPFYHAFLDGFDTRAIAKAGGGIVTNDADGNAIPVLDQWGVANTADTVRAVFLADLKKRFDKLYQLQCGTNLNNIFWSSSYIDAAASTNDAPAPHFFNWTQDLPAEIYGSDFELGYTRWLPCFDAMPYATNYCFRPAAANIPFAYSGIFYDLVLPAIDLDLPWRSYNVVPQISGGPIPSATPFDDVAQTVYPDVFGEVGSGTVITNLALATARHNFRQIAQADAALSLFDRTYRFDPMPVAFTNEMGISGHVYESANVTLAGGNDINLQHTGGEWYAPELDLDHTTVRFYIDGSIDEDAGVSWSNNYRVAYAPRSRCIGPTVEFGIVSSNNAALADYLSLPTSGDEFQTLAARFIAAYQTVEGHEEDMASWVCFSATPNYQPFPSVLRMEGGDEESALVTASVNCRAISRPTNGVYHVDWTAILAATYNAALSALPYLPYGATNYYPQSSQFLATNTVRHFMFSSFCESSNPATYARDINYGGGSGADWPYHGDFGYRANVIGSSLRAHPSVWRDNLLSELVVLQQKAQISSFNILDPNAATGINKADLRAAITNVATSVNYPESDMSLADGLGVCWLEYDGERYRLYDDEDTDDDGNMREITYVPVFMYNLGVSVTVPSYGITINTNCTRAVDTKLQSVTEANWDFPQLRTTDKDY